MLKKYRKEASWGAVVLLVVISVILNFFAPQIGLSFSMAGLVAVIGFAVLSALVAFAYEIVFIGKQQFVRYFIIAFSVLLIASWLTPLQDWIMSILPV